MYSASTPTCVKASVAMSAHRQSPPSIPARGLEPLRCPTEMQFYTPSSTNLFVRYLPREVDDNRLREIFSVYGAITSSMVMRDIHSGQSLGTAFVRFSNHQEALRALCEAHGMPLFGKCISVQWAKQQHDVTPAGQDRLKMNKLFVRNVPMDVTEQELIDLVSSYGTVKKVTLHNDTAPIVDLKARRHIVFITFMEEGAAESALRAVHNTCTFKQCCGVPLMCKLINDAIKSKKHRLRSVSMGSQSNEMSPGAVVTPASASGSAVDGSTPTTICAAEGISGEGNPSFDSSCTYRLSPLASCADESTSTTPNISYGNSSWDIAPTAVAPFGVLAGVIPVPMGTLSSPCSQRGNTSDMGLSPRFCHNPYSMSGEKIFV
ncbi:hypothetical protein ABL78_4982 [Leptomonas seymouri]|uniref:RRM domain-containing protein n=1 Tax=Leptomonas seymouri TaxID=5684 RepID=A0A0N0P516_LEPSE|nr:hypothetical protein ABL78_4982 [Leptomonas seymouri]|eukprot:KPI85939.1 hypothetical protein ABL78_4982 [Leptomonas seymouri]